MCSRLIAVVLLLSLCGCIADVGYVPAPVPLVVPVDPLWGLYGFHGDRFHGHFRGR